MNYTLLVGTPIGWRQICRHTLPLALLRSRRRRGLEFQLHRQTSLTERITTVRNQKVFGTRFLGGAGAWGGRRRFRGGPVVVVRFQYRRATSASSLETAFDGFTAGVVIPVDLACLSQPFTTAVWASSPVSSLENRFSRSQICNMFSFQICFFYGSKSQYTCLIERAEKDCTSIGSDVQLVCKLGSAHVYKTRHCKKKMNLRL